MQCLPGGIDSWRVPLHFFFGMKGDLFLIICAAIQVRFERNGKIIETVVPGYRHENCWELLSVFDAPTNRQEIEGFLNHHGEFLDRYNAFTHALQCGQLSDTTRAVKAERKEQQLYSEDLY